MCHFREKNGIAEAPSDGFVPKLTFVPREGVGSFRVRIAEHKWIVWGSSTENYIEAIFLKTDDGKVVSGMKCEDPDDCDASVDRPGYSAYLDMPDVEASTLTPYYKSTILGVIRGAPISFTDEAIQESLAALRRSKKAEL